MGQDSELRRGTLPRLIRPSGSLISCLTFRQNDIIILTINCLTTGQRIRILKLLTDGGCSMQAISRVEGVSLNTIKKLLREAGRACAAYHDEVVRGVRSERIQVDEIWSFIYAKQSHVERAKAAPTEAGERLDVDGHRRRRQAPDLVDDRAA